MSSPAAMVMEDAATALLPAIRRALQRREVDQAREQFLQLPSLARRHREWLEEVLRDGYTAGMLDVQALLTFLEALPHWHWTLDGCCVLHRVNVALQRSALHAVRVPTMPLAYFLHKLLNHLDGSARVRAESYWFEWVSPTMRAIVEGRTVTIRSVARQEVLYTAADDRIYDSDRRCVFTWRGDWVPDRQKEEWRLIPANAQRDRFYVQSVAYGEYLYAADYSKYGRDAQGNVRSRVFTWRRTRSAVGEMGHWQLLAVEGGEEQGHGQGQGQGHSREEFALYNTYQKEFLYSPEETQDAQRRMVLSMRPAQQEPAWMELRKWRVVPTQFSGLDAGIEAFYTRAYPVAVTQLSQVLAQERDDPSAMVRCLIYRMAANLRLGAEDETLVSDFDQLRALGGDKVAIFHGLHHLWQETATYLESINEDGLPEDTAVFTLAPILAQAEALFVRREYPSALASYQRITRYPFETEDTSLLTLFVEAQLASAKCCFALAQYDQSRSVLDNVTHLEQVNANLQAHVWMWRAKGKRQARQLDEAAVLLEKALDCVAPLSNSESARTTQSLLVEMRLISIYRQELLDELLTRCDDDAVQREFQPLASSSGPVRASAGTIRQMMELFLCPLSLEVMHDPVTSPNGDTYEREMIERHLEVNGNFDPMTRAPLLKSQLYPNRALKLTMEIMLSEHRLGLLLAASGA